MTQILAIQSKHKNKTIIVLNTTLINSHHYEYRRRMFLSSCIHGYHAYNDMENSWSVPEKSVTPKTDMLSPFCNFRILLDTYHRRFQEFVVCLYCEVVQSVA